jgi:hypothetical protein
MLVITKKEAAVEAGTIDLDTEVGVEAMGKIEEIDLVVESIKNLVVIVIMIMKNEDGEEALASTTILNRTTRDTPTTTITTAKSTTTVGKVEIEAIVGAERSIDTTNITLENDLVVVLLHLHQKSTDTAKLDLLILIFWQI